MFGRNARCVAMFWMVSASLGIAPLAAIAQGESAEIRESARMMARVDHSVRNKDLKGYCAATVGAPGYAGYVERACQSGMKNNMKTAQDCTPEKVSAQVAADRAQCLAMSAEKFDEAASQQPQRRAQWIKMAGARGVDGEKLLDEERAKLK